MAKSNGEMPIESKMMVDLIVLADDLWYVLS